MNKYLFKIGDRVIFLGHTNIHGEAKKAVGKQGIITRISIYHIEVKFAEPVGFNGTHIWHVPSDSLKLAPRQMFFSFMND